MDVIKWLLEKDAPGVAYLARRDLLDEDAGSRKMTTLKRRSNEYEPIAHMLDRVGASGELKDYKKTVQVGHVPSHERSEALWATR